MCKRVLLLITISFVFSTHAFATLSYNNSWSPLKNMGSAINSDKRDFCPMVTPDGKYFFFSSKRVGEGDIFWVDGKVIKALRDD